MTDPMVETIRDLIQEDVGHRGLRSDPTANLITACAGDFQAACRSLAATSRPVIAVLTGFFIPHGQPPSAETDGPLGALFLARALVPLGMQVYLVTDPFCEQALQVGLAACGLHEAVRVLTLPPPAPPWDTFLQRDWQWALQPGGLTHLIALERVGPSHTVESLGAQPGVTAAVLEQFRREVPAEHHDCCHTMRGRDITAQIAPAHLLVEAARRQQPPVTTIGIGDGGNEIGMGKIPWAIIHRNIPGGGLVACRVPTEHLLVCGISNWGAYGLAAGVRWLRGAAPGRDLFDLQRERELLRVLVEQGPLVDGITGQPTLTVDALSFEQYAEPLRRLHSLGF